MASGRNGASTRVLVRAGHRPETRQTTPWEGTLRPPPRQPHQQEHEVVEPAEIAACVPWHETLDTRDSFAVGRCHPVDQRRAELWDIARFESPKHRHQHSRKSFHRFAVSSGGAKPWCFSSWSRGTPAGR